MADPYRIAIKTTDGEDSFSADLRGYGDPKEDDYAAGLVLQLFDSAIAYLYALRGRYVRGAAEQEKGPVVEGEA